MGPQVGGQGIAVVAGIMVGRLKRRLRGVLAELAVECRVIGGADYRREAFPPRGRAATVVGCPHDRGTKTQYQEVQFVVVHINTASGGAKSRTEIVRGAHRRRKKHNPIHAVFRQGFGSSQDHRRTGTVTQQIDALTGTGTPMGIDLNRQATALVKMVLMAGLVGDNAPKPPRPLDSFDLQGRAGFRRDLDQIP